MCGRGEQGRRCADVRRDDMWAVQTECVGDANDELAHRFRVHQVFAAFRMAKSR
jgi:hypothetical protein